MRGDAPSWPPGAFLIGNHADELTPWVPVLASVTPSCAGFVNIPCCAWKLDGTRFTPTQARFDLADVAAFLLGTPSSVTPQEPPHAQPVVHDPRTLAAHTQWFAQRLTSEPDDHGHSKHRAYYAYIAELHLHTGWCLETEALRIPSTKNWAFVARTSLAALHLPAEAAQTQSREALLAYAAACAPTSSLPAPEKQ